MKFARVAVAVLFLAGRVAATGQESLPGLVGGAAPGTLAELWDGYDPRAEPLDVEVLHEWEEDGVALKVLRSRAGVFKGQKAMVAAVYGAPVGGEALPGLVQIHGGGQYADYRAPLTNAKRGYATISVAWAGRVNAPGYRVGPDEVKLFWEGAIDDPRYKVTTDWGAVDGYHAPCREEGNAFSKIPEPAEWTLDPVASPRNNGWFLGTVAARRALTFLEQQPEVDPAKLGVYGHSMGGKLTVLTAGSDARVKAAVPSCGGVSDRYNDDPMFRATLGDEPYLMNLTCPVVFLSPSNDFHGRINDLQTALGEIGSDDWRAVCTPHHNHQDTAAAEVATQLWFDQHLRGEFSWPETPGAELRLDTRNRVPEFTVWPDSGRAILSVDVFYTQDADPGADRDGAVSRFWHHAQPEPNDGGWVAQLPIATTAAPLWVYAHVTYQLDAPVTGAGYYYREYTAREFTLSSPMAVVTAADLQAAGTEVTLAPTVMIEPFDTGWEKEWFTYQPDEWLRSTHKVNDPRHAAPVGAALSLEVRCEKSNVLVVGIDGFAAEVPLVAGHWQKVWLVPSDLTDARGNHLLSWDGIMELRLAGEETLRASRPDASRKFGRPWNGAAPEFRNLRWEEPGSAAPNGSGRSGLNSENQETSLAG